MIKKIVTLLVLLVLVMPDKPLYAQSYEKEFESIFAWEVKQIDEFMERFNNTDKTLIKEYSKKLDPGTQITRERLIKSLFNAESKSWDFKEISSFIEAVDNTDKPVYLNFFDNDWYARVNCSVTWKGQPQTVTLIMKMFKQEDGASKWVISGVNAAFLRNSGNTAIYFPTPADSKASLNPVSHATDFMNIDQVTRDRKNISNYFLRASQYKDQLPAFMQECINQSLVINKVNSISYHFLQVDNWIFEIKQFNRQTKNSGWLISKLVKVSAQEKDSYRAQVLNK